jgi:zinc resistance-associated protein
MTSKLTRKSLLVAAILLIAGVAIAFAHGGRGGYGGYMGGSGNHMKGYGGHMMDDNGYGPHMRGDRRGYGRNLSEEDAAKLEQERKQFFEQTRPLREQMDEKAQALRQEMNQENPDKAKLSQLQQELSELRGQFDQKRIEHRLEVRKILPEGAAGPGSGHGRGFGRGAGRGNGGGYCW